MSAARTWMWRAVYELLGARVRTRDWAFMNYGYAPGGDVDSAGTAVPLDPADEADRLCIQLYAATVDGVDLTDLDVLEVGSGRGGGAQYLARYRRARSVTGLDFSRAAVDLSTRHRSGPGLRFRVGDAAATGLPDGCVDVVVNVESSHCYASMDDFVAEVHRVLRPGGHFVWADLRGSDDVEDVRRRLSGSGLTPVDEEDITDGVLLAMRLDNDRKAGLVRAWIPRPFRRAIRPFAGLERTATTSGSPSPVWSEPQLRRAQRRQPAVPARPAREAPGQRPLTVRAGPCAAFLLPGCRTRFSVDDGSAEGVASTTG